MRFALTTALLCLPLWLAGPTPAPQSTELLRHPDSPEFTRPAPAKSRVALMTSKGTIVIEVTRDWAPLGADRFYNLARLGYYNDMRIHRVVEDKWAQFGINGTPAIAQAWRTATFADDPFIKTHSNVRGTVAFAFKDKNARTTQLFINLRNNAATHDLEPFVPFGTVVEGMDVADALNKEYGETSGGGIRAGKQDPLFEGGNAYFDKMWPRLDRIIRATVAGER